MNRRSIPEQARETLRALPDGHLIRQLDWPEPACPSRGSLLFMPGRGDAYEKYLESFEHWRGQGWSVTAADWRGQAGSGRLGMDPHTGHIDDFAIWIADIAEFWRHWADGRVGPLVLVGHSMGGHLTLRAVADGVLDPSPGALVLSAPMLGVLPEFVPNFAKQALANVMASIGDARRPAWKWSEKPGELPPGRQDLLTQDDERYADEQFWRDRRPELVMGPGSWGWTAAALRSIRWIERRGYLETVQIPTLVIATSADKLVGIKAIRRAVVRLPKGEALYFGEESAHEILRERDPVRQRALAEIDAFLERVTA